ncbi:recombination regulator RecX [Nocardia jinanensis]|uniref:recombination regulator RecX n=1 Tax=Nocardia jinanensis TaxID=382504 RepID=UPI001E5AF6FA|nr:recombination regulator RecX [Nocardia jinanensis]
MAAGGAAPGAARGSRPDEPDPQRARPADSGAPDGASVQRRSASRESAGGDAAGSLEQAKEVCLRLLAVRARSRAELAQRLSAKEYPPEVIDQVLDRLAEIGLIDDIDFAQQWVRQRHGFSGKGRRALEQELRRKGVSQEDSAVALETVTADDEYERATELVRRKLRSLPAGLEREKAIRRLVGMLARRGYGHSVAYAVVKAEWDGADGLGHEDAPLD